VGTSFNGVRNEILSPDPVTGEGEIIVSSRGVFMGYVKVCIFYLYKSSLITHKKYINYFYTLYLTRVFIHIKKYTNIGMK
jgi:hypothetical protein